MTFSLFFLNLYPRFAKKDIYKCPFSEKGLRELKFAYIDVIKLFCSISPKYENILKLNTLYLLKKTVVVK